MWLPFIIEYVFQIELAWLGIYPRTWSGLKGILFAPFIHGDINHLMNNSVPMLVLGSLTYYFYKPIFYKAFFNIIFFGGLITWFIARDSFHIGASGVIYGLASLLFFSGMFRKSYRLVAVSLLVVFLYGSMVWGVLPLEERISFESHLAGAVVGFAIAFRYRKWLFVEKKVYQWKNDEEDIKLLEAKYGERFWENPPIEDQQLTIRYFFRSKEEES
ncbi:MAG: rhomboid family intramembrane serine protease [Crocinitomicaceae bacterium]|nr:rhomboid family intramembrane serine protease [Crocinitomicaceae bacterium]|tara:strand:+ start:11362 stop:12009 length:648 start_codon:yes stop_codon:yes gene_type:complete